MVITPEDLADWNSHPVTKAIFKEINDSVIQLRAESTLRPTADETAMTTAKNEGIAIGAEALKDTYEILSEDAEEFHGHV